MLGAYFVAQAEEKGVFQGVHFVFLVFVASFEKRAYASFLRDYTKLLIGVRLTN